MDNISQQISQMESLDAETSEDAIKQLKDWMCEGNAIAQLVEYYVTNQSIRALELLCLVQEPHDKVLLNEMLEHMNKNRHRTLVSMGRIVQRAPSWLVKIPHHNLFRTIIGSIQLNEDREYISAAILFITSIIPHATIVNESFVEELIEVFAKACRILECEQKNSLATDQFHQRLIRKLQVRSIEFAAVELFHALYALYPCHLVHSLRNLNIKPSDAVYRIVAKIFLTVRLHPALIFESKDSELGRERWMANEPHDFFALSRKLSAAKIIDHDSDDANKENVDENEANPNLYRMQNLPETLQIGDSGDGLPFLSSELMTPPLNGSSQENINESISHRTIELLPEMQSAIHEHPTFVQRIGTIFRPKNSLNARKMSETPKVNENIVEHTGNYIDGNAVSGSMLASSYRNTEWAVECVESMEYDCVDKTAEQLIKTIIAADRPSTSSLKTTSDKRTTSESHTDHSLNADQQFISCQNIGRASSLTNLYDVKDTRHKISKNRNTAPVNLCLSCRQSRKENNLQKFEDARQAYINAAIDHHQKIKTLNLLSQTPGRMYDDMHHITKELPLDQQCEVLFARLRLVNQHLLFERYCRIMHENRNRRLFGKLKQCRTEAAERRTWIELEHSTSVELQHQLKLYSQLNQEYLLTREQCTRNEDLFARELEKCKKEKSSLLCQLEALQRKYVEIKTAQDTDRKRLNQALLQKENLIADKKLVKIKLKELDLMKAEFRRLQQDKLYLEMQLRKKTEKTGVPRNRAEDMIAPLYEAQLKNARLQLRNTKMVLSRMTEKTSVLEARWKEELDRRFDLQSTLNHASLVHSKNLESAAHKFNALLAVCNKQEAHIFNLHRALEQTESTKSDSKKSQLSFDSTASMSSKPHMISKPDDTFDYDSTYIFSDVENHTKIAGLFSSFGEGDDNMETNQSAGENTIYWASADAEPNDSVNQTAAKTSD